MLRRILSSSLAGWVDPARAFVELHSRAPDAFWLDAGPGAVAGLSYLGVGEPLATARDLVGLVDSLRCARESLGAVEAGRTAFGLGWVGYLGYEFGAAALGADTSGAQASGSSVTPGELPGSALLWVPRAIAFDHGNRSVTLLALDGEPDAAGWLERTAVVLESLEQASGPVSPRPFALATEAAPGGGVPVARWRHTPDTYEALIRQCQESIRRGDAYQLCLTNEITIEVRPDPLTTYLALRATSPSHHGGYLRTGGIALLSASPEQFLRVDSRGVAETKPIKGTRPRSSSAEEDQRLADELLASDKERAENLMIVDLMRNDLARVARLGSVEVTKLLALESYSSVHQLVSTVTAQLADGLDALDAVLALFPAGSMTGAPKHSAVGILNRLEGGPRGIYAGVFGYLSLDGSLDLAMVIRSLVLTPRGVSIGTGGGITALSVPSEEVEETRVKAAPLLQILGVRPRGASGRPAV